MDFLDYLNEIWPYLAMVLTLGLVIFAFLVQSLSKEPVECVIVANQVSPFTFLSSTGLLLPVGLKSGCLSIAILVVGIFILGVSCWNKKLLRVVATIFQYLFFVLAGVFFLLVLLAILSPSDTEFPEGADQSLEALFLFFSFVAPCLYLGSTSLYLKNRIKAVPREKYFSRYLIGFLMAVALFSIEFVARMFGYFLIEEIPLDWWLASPFVLYSFGSLAIWGYHYWRAVQT